MNPTVADGYLLRVVLYLLVFWPTVGYYVYDDSTRRGLSYPVPRGVLLGFLGVPGLVVHLVVRQP